LKRHLVTATLILAIGFVVAALGYYWHQGATEHQATCQAKGLEPYRLGSQQICREHDTGLLYAP
jgi:hypothetical protein